MIPGRHALHLRTDLGDYAGALVAEHAGARLLDRAPLHQEVGVTDAAGGEPHPHVRGAEVYELDVVADLERGVPLAQDGGPHTLAGRAHRSPTCRAR
ncbi:MAG: hypothetical protein ACYS0D_15440 [Planctomycetota bacterium]